MTAASQLRARKALTAEILKCRRCPGMNEPGLSQAAPGYGSILSPVVLVGQSLCTECMATGIPFTGGSGLLIDEALRDSGLDKADIFTTNVVHCHPARPDNRKSLPHEKERCRPFLQREIELVGPRLVIGLGGDAKEALRFLYPDTTELPWGQIDQPTSHSAGPPMLSFTYHPSYVKRPQRGETRHEREARQRQWVKNLAAAFEWSFRLN
ncbi:uracil-DNA glycosylase [Mycobacterium colombiense]|uniref:uracil-DNA glycosylase n=1 Tax=Mycobacterium colombiense TaxID=339268 RepID=UPI00096C0E7D|nr:uracil-DNA glycosylase family protein [Mycobacterium colombiense]OMC22454.1 hypothetical protein A5737_21520 [Mycobacterium colombiense]